MYNPFEIRSLKNSGPWISLGQVEENAFVSAEIPPNVSSHDLAEFNREILTTLTMFLNVMTNFITYSAETQ